MFRWNGTDVIFDGTREAYESQFSGYQIQPGKRENWKVQIGLSGNTYFSHSIHGAVNPLSEPMSYADLPQALRDSMWNTAYKEGLEWARHHFQMLPGNP